MRVRLQIVGIFIAVGLGALTITLLHDAKALIPHAPYGDWILVRIFVLSSLASLGMLLVFGLEDDLADIDETDGSLGRPIHWGVIRLAFLISALASAVFIGASALVDYLDRASA
jgi:hypothetical protein